MKRIRSKLAEVGALRRPDAAARRPYLMATLNAGLCFAFTPCASAHEVRPAYLELRQTGTDTYDVLWKVPARGDNMRLGIYVEFPSGTTNVTTPRTLFANDASTERWSIKRPGGLTGGEIHITGLAATMTDVLVRD